ncbi:MAG: NAD-dependent epimerase/dehydratase family protein [Anaerolineae bacterium]|nr:NAD-dependent epimerase/dehydratase family protein [Anaerolineae bacterium]
MPKNTILITGAAGEIGHALVKQLSADNQNRVITLDLVDLPADLNGSAEHHQGSVTDPELMAEIIQGNQVTTIYHLAALLSTSAERYPHKAHQVNVGGTTLLLELAAFQSQASGVPVKFIFPSSMAVYGMPDLDTKARFPAVPESDWLFPTTMYGVNKLYCELLGDYYSSHYKQLAEEPQVMLDFRALRFPGLISAFTVPTGGTSDYGPEMLHAAAQGKPYACFVRPDASIAFMAMPDAIKSLLLIAEAPAASLSRRAYNVTSFSLSAEEFRQEVLKSFSDAQISYQPHRQRQGIVDSWPVGIDDTAARQDWDWQPEYDLQRCFEEYLVPNIKKRYQIPA